MGEEAPLIARSPPWVSIAVGEAIVEIEEEEEVAVALPSMGASSYDRHVSVRVSECARE